MGTTDLKIANAQDPDRIAVDVELIRMFLKMTAEQRIAANDNAIRAIEELRNGFTKSQPTDT